MARNTVIHATLYLQDQVTAQSEDELQNAIQCEHNTALYFEYLRTYLLKSRQVLKLQVHKSDIKLSIQEDSWSMEILIWSQKKNTKLAGEKLSCLRPLLDFTRSK